MSKQPILYYSCINGVAFDNFASDAAIGARDEGIKTVRFEDIDEVPYDPYNIVVASVEDTQKYLGKTIPVIDHSWATGYFSRDFEQYDSIDELEDFMFPCFIKPANEIKAFTGFVTTNKEFFKVMSYDYKGPIIRQEVLHIESEFRVYMSKTLGMLGMYYYLGDPFTTPDEEFVRDVCSFSQDMLDEQSYSLDFGVTVNGETFLIEANDGWALGNYGLPPKKYYHFVKNRFLQLTGVIK